jgi:CheY-like chemotaxis protein
MAAVILLIDDDEILPYVLERGIARDGCNGILRCVNSGQEGIDYLCHTGKYDDPVQFPFPSVVLLDLNMPGVHGFDVLEWKNTRPEFKSLPFVVWSSSSLPEDRSQAMALGAADYLLKPMDLGDLIKLIQALADRFPTASD